MLTYKYIKDTTGPRYKILHNLGYKKNAVVSLTAFFVIIFVMKKLKVIVYIYDYIHIRNLLRKDEVMSSARGSLIKSVAGFFIAAMCFMYPQQIGGFIGKFLTLFSNIFGKILSGELLKAIGI